MLAARGFAQKLGRVLGLRGAEAGVGVATLAAGAGAGAGSGLVRGAVQMQAPVSGDAPVPVAVPVAVPVMQAPEFAGKRVLVADDSEINRTILRTFLERIGFEVTLAADGAEAMERWRPEHDLVCLDIEMPKFDGLSTLKRIRAAAGDAGAPAPMALAVTVNALTQEVTDYMKAGFDACLPKPFSRSDLVDILRRRWPAQG